MQISFLKDIKPHKTAWRVQVKVLHSWRQWNKIAGDSLELILLDANGTKIHASCKKTYMGQLASKVPVGKWINIDHFGLTGAGRTYRTTNNVYRMNFVHNTSITPSTLQIEDNFLDLVDFDTILRGKPDINILIDVIGQVLDFGDLKTIHCTGEKERKKLEFTLRNISDERLPCCLWGTYAENIYTACQEAEDGFIVYLLRFAKIGNFRGEVQISNAYDASQIFINPDIAEAKAFQQRDCVDSQAITISESADNKIEKKIVRDKWMQYQLKNIVELLESTQIEQCRVVATICAIDTDWGWYYFGCLDCSRKVYPESKTVKRVNGKEVLSYVWWCEQCQKLVYSVSPKFKIHLLVKDNIGESSFMLLDSIAKGIVPQSAEYLLNDTTFEARPRSNLPGAGEAASRRRWPLTLPLLLSLFLMVLSHFCYCVLPFHIYWSIRGGSPQRTQRRSRGLFVSDLPVVFSLQVTSSPATSREGFLAFAVFWLSGTVPFFHPPLVQDTKSQRFMRLDLSFLSDSSIYSSRKVVFSYLACILLNGRHVPLRRNFSGDLFYGTVERLSYNTSLSKGFGCSGLIFIHNWAGPIRATKPASPNLRLPRPKFFKEDECQISTGLSVWSHISPYFFSGMILSVGSRNLVLISSSLFWKTCLLPQFLLLIKGDVFSVLLSRYSFRFLTGLSSYVAVCTGPEDAIETILIFLVGESCLSTSLVTILLLSDFVVKASSTHSSLVLNPLSSSSFEDFSCLTFYASIVYLEDTSSFPEAINSLIGQTFMFGVYIKNNNATAGGVCYKVGKVWKDLRIKDGDENNEAPDITSTSKKPCTKLIKKEKK
ncbi:hypothetical protein N665_0156s0017 [Sinapis alba]|nr:hypothetical protein N665_0156s0017 [Sinapis alba]